MDYRNYEARAAETACWPWYGEVAYDSSPRVLLLEKGYRSVRKLVYEAVTGRNAPPRLFPVACGNPACVNPSHMSETRVPYQLEDVDADAVCPRGHSLRKYGRKIRTTGIVQCRICAADAHRRSRARERDLLGVIPKKYVDVFTDDVVEALRGAKPKHWPMLVRWLCAMHPGLTQVACSHVTGITQAAGAGRLRSGGQGMMSPSEWLKNHR